MHSLGDLARAIQVTTEHHPHLHWHVADPSTLPNGRYVVDHETSTVYLSSHLGEGDLFRSALDALAELRQSSAAANVIAFPASDRASGDRGRTG